MSMTSRERVYVTLRHEEPDRVPFNMWLVDEVARQFGGQEEFEENFGHDIRSVALNLPERPEDVPVIEWVPSPTEQEIARAAGDIRAFQERGLAVTSSYFMGVYEQAKDWLGDEAAMVGIYEDPKGFGQLLDRITEWKCACYGSYVSAGVDIAWIGDDLGTQRSLVMSPNTYREWYKPRHVQIVDHLRSIRPDVKIAFHSCGHVTPLIPDLIEVGIDILQAVQAECMDIGGLKREFGRDLSFWGGVGAQSVLASSTPEGVKAGVRHTLDLMAPGGGYIAAPCHHMTEEVTRANIIAFHEAMAAYGAYSNTSLCAETTGVR
ncbi:MAG: uroporphyrinogen decarboxylase family protein [Armatimonadota bacterium]